MTHAFTKAGLSPARKRLVQMMQEINFGRIEELAIAGGEPTFDPAPRVVRHIKIGGENGPRPEMEHSDFALKTQVIELFDHFKQIGNGSIATLEIQHGLPFRLVVQHPA